MALVEIVRGQHTDLRTLNSSMKFVLDLGKEPILVNDSPGFASSRLGIVLGLEAIRMVEAGVASPEDIDKAMVLGYRHPMGPLRLTDLVGLDVRLGIARYLHEALGSEAFRPPALLERMVAEGRLGKKSGPGVLQMGRRTVNSGTVRLSVQDGVAEVTIDRPGKLNALNEAVRGELTEVFDELAGRDDVKVAILNGAGDKAFVAGADVGEFAGRTAQEQREVYRHRRVYDALAEFPKPVICAIHGFCIGGGNELALACDVRVADTTARFGQFEIRLGLIPGAGGTQRLARLVGPGQALRIGLSGDLIDAREAHRIGLVELLADEGEHLAAARELAARMTRWSPVTLQLVKKAVREAYERPLSDGLAAEKELFLEAFASEDGREGVRAFVEKRRPRFRGR